MTSSDTVRLEREAENHRARVDTSLEELKERLSVGRIVDEVWEMVQGGQGADAVRNFGRQVRDNPLAIGLIGAGVAWLMMGDGMRGGRRDRHDDWYQDSTVDRWRESLASAPSDRGTGPVGAKQDSGPGIAESAQAAAGKTAESVTDAANKVGESTARTADHLRATVSDAAKGAGAGISDAAQSARETVQSYGGPDQARAAGSHLYRTGDRVRRGLVDTLYEEPLVFGGLAVALGAAIGAVLPPTRQEDRLMSAARDRLRDEAIVRGRDVADRVEAVAKKTFEAASDEAAEQGLVPKGGDETVAEKLADVAETATATAKSEAKKQDLT